MNVYAARWKNAQKIAHRLKALLAGGYIIRDENDERVDVAALTDQVFHVQHKGSRCRIIMFENDREYDHGLYTPIAEFNAKFAGWIVYHPKDARPLLTRRKPRIKSLGNEL